MTIAGLETILLLLTLIFAAWRPDFATPFFHRFERAFCAIARRRRASILLIVLAALLGRLMLLPVEPIPEPQVHDEFSHLLAADTFSRGRLSNPTHPLWVHFESPHIDQIPTYMSMYPPGQGLMMALGKVLFGQEWYGVWLCTAAMCGALVWMLQGWLPSKWALFGGVVSVVRLCLFSYWGNSYWGGSLAATAGLLALGAFPRLLQRRCWTDALLVGVAFAVLAITRPYEGLVFAISFLATLWYWKRRVPRAPAYPWIHCVAFGAPIILSACFLLYFDWRAFGSPFALPYSVNRAQYAVAGVYLWEKPKPEPLYRHQALRNIYVGYELYHFNRARSLTGFTELFSIRLLRIWSFFIGPLLTPLFVTGLYFANRPRIRPMLWIGCGFGCGLLAEAWFSAHYAAPMLGLFYLIMIHGARHLRLLRFRQRRLGLQFLRLAMLTLLLMIPIRSFSNVLGLDITTGEPSWASRISLNIDRSAVVRRLDANYKHLILVRYREDHHPNVEWVYNSADIDAAKVVWARDMGTANQRLLEYFHDRRTWLFEPDVNAGLVPYSP